MDERNAQRQMRKQMIEELKKQKEIERIVFYFIVNIN